MLSVKLVDVVFVAVFVCEQMHTDRTCFFLVSVLSILSQHVGMNVSQTSKLVKQNTS